MFSQSLKNSIIYFSAACILILSSAVNGQVEQTKELTDLSLEELLDIQISVSSVKAKDISFKRFCNRPKND